MVDALLLASKVLFAAVGGVAALRLAQLSRRPDGSATQAWASVMLLVGGVGLVGFGLGPGLGARSEVLARAVMVVSDALERLALVLLALFVWRVFGGGRGSRRAILAAVLLVVGADWVQTLWLQSWPRKPTTGPGQVASQLAFAAPFLWSTLEVALEYRRSRRQRVLGLADPAVTNRFFLWSFACGCFTVICLATALAAAVAEGGALASALAVLRALLYQVIGGTVLLGFFPPRAYRDWLALPGPR